MLVGVCLDADAVHWWASMGMLVYVCASVGMRVVIGRWWRRELVCIDGDVGSLVCVEWRRLIGCGLWGGRDVLVVGRGVIAVGSWWAPMGVRVVDRSRSGREVLGYGSRWGDWLGVCADGRVECW